MELCNPYRPEEVNSYEMGLKTRFADGRIIFNVAAFWNEHKDIQLSVFTAGAGASSIVRNAARPIRALSVSLVRPLARPCIVALIVWSRLTISRRIEADVRVTILEYKKIAARRKLEPLVF